MNKKLVEKLIEIEDTCINAVYYVGKANYAEREIEAIYWVREAFEKLNNTIDTENKTREKRLRDRKRSK